jgi:hypothetical protein
MLFVQGHFTFHQYTTEADKQEVSLEVNIEKFSFADESKSESISVSHASEGIPGGVA